MQIKDKDNFRKQKSLFNIHILKKGLYFCDSSMLDQGPRYQPEDCL